MDSGVTWSRARIVVSHGSKSICPNAAVYDRQGATKADRQTLYLQFAAKVIAPLMGGAILIVSGLRKLL